MVSGLFEPIGDYIKEIETGSMPAVHHYTTLKGALGILKTGQLWFTERAHLNDPTEIWLGVEIAAKTFGTGSEAASRLLENAKVVFENFRFFSASFSFEPDHLSQWRSYADDGKGVAVSFKSRMFDNPKTWVDKWIAGDPTAFVCPISYDRRVLERVIREIVNRWNGENIRELCDHIFMISSMFKHEAWSSEKEYRFFIHHRRDQIVLGNCYKMREQNHQIVSYLEVPIQGWNEKCNFPIFRMRAGPAASSQIETQLADFIMSNELPIAEHMLMRSDIPSSSFHQNLN